MSAVPLAGCATASNNITATYASPLLYQGYDCQQILAETQRVQGRVNQIGGRLDQAASNDKALVGVGMILFWPALFALGGTKEQEAEYARLKGEYEALQKSGCRQTLRHDHRRCGQEPDHACHHARRKPTARSRCRLGCSLLIPTFRTTQRDKSMKLNSVRAFGLCVGMAGVALISGCASPASSTNMTVRAAESTTLRQATPEAMKTNIAIKDVTGGKETNPAWVSNVSSSEFERALEDSLRAVGMLSGNRQSGRYQLVAHLSKLDQPLIGFSMTVTSSVTYTLIERATGKTVWEMSIEAPYTAAVGDAFIGSERLRLANEGSIRQNISRLVGELQAMKVAEVQVK
jgi:hypothetical protein